MVKRVNLPRDELPHGNQAVEWWYFNGFLEGKKSKYAFMTCLFKADKDKINLNFLKFPMKTIYFSHSIIYDIKRKTSKKEILPIVILSSDSFERKDLFINYFFPIRKNFCNYEISRFGDKFRVKTRFFDFLAREKKCPLLEGGNGYLNFGEKDTYYYSYTDLEVDGFVGNEKVKGKAWFDRQWSGKGFMQDSWIWFSLHLHNNVEIVCFNYEGKKMACISYPDGRQECCSAYLISLGNKWKSPKSKLEYQLSWKLKVKNFVIETRPIMNDCEMNFGFLNYWEGPIEVKCNGRKTYGFMENLSEEKSNLGGANGKHDNLIKKIIAHFI